jgi:hypothetical protein
MKISATKIKNTYLHIWEYEVVTTYKSRLCQTTFYSFETFGIQFEAGSIMEQMSLKGVV